MGEPTVECVEVDSVTRSAENHERSRDLLRVAPERVEESDAVAHGARHDVLALDERPNEPDLVADETQSKGQPGQLLDHSVPRPGFELRDDVVRLKAACQLQHPPRGAV